MTRFAACFILVFGELAWGGLFALAIPPFFNVERGFYKSSASVYLAASITTAVGLGLLALRGGASAGPGAVSLWTASALWTLSSAAVAVYLTSGPSRRLKLGAQMIEFRHAPIWQLIFPGRAAGEVVRALAWLGPEKAGEAIQKLRTKLPASELKEVASARSRLPTWMAQQVSALVAHG